MAWRGSDSELEARIAAIVDARVDGRVRSLVRDNVLRAEQAPRSLPPSKLASGGAATGEGLVWNGTMWVPQDVATQAELDAVEAAAIPKSIGDAKGDLVGFSADNTPVKIDGSGASDGDVLVFDSGETAGVGWSGPSWARLDPSSIANHTNNGGWQKVGLNSSSSAGSVLTVDTSNNRITANRDCEVLVSGNLSINAAITAGYTVAVAPYKNGGPYVGTLVDNNPAVNRSANSPMVLAATPISLSSGDYLELWCFQNISSSLAYLSDGRYTFFSVTVL